MQENLQEVNKKIKVYKEVYLKEKEKFLKSKKLYIDLKNKLDVTTDKNEIIELKKTISKLVLIIKSSKAKMEESKINITKIKEEFYNRLNDKKNNLDNDIDKKNEKNINLKNNNFNNINKKDKKNINFKRLKDISHLKEKLYEKFKNYAFNQYKILKYTISILIFLILSTLILKAFDTTTSTLSKKEFQNIVNSEFSNLKKDDVYSIINKINRVAKNFNINNATSNDVNIILDSCIKEYENYDIDIERLLSYTLRIDTTRSFQVSNTAKILQYCDGGVSLNGGNISVILAHSLMVVTKHDRKARRILNNSKYSKYFEFDYTTLH